MQRLLLQRTDAHPQWHPSFSLALLLAKEIRAGSDAHFTNSLKKP